MVPMLITKAPLPYNEKKLVGYCCSNLHRGFLTEKLYKEHNCGDSCGNNLCKRFVKCENGSMWRKIEYTNNQKQAAKKEKKRKKEMRKRQQEYFKCIINTAEACASFFNIAVLFTSVVQKSARGIVIYYCSDNEYNDWYMLYDIKLILQEVYNVSVKLVHIKNLQGEYATGKIIPKNS